jgi:hypothetical protein
LEQAPAHIIEPLAAPCVHDARRGRRLLNIGGRGIGRRRTLARESPKKIAVPMLIVEFTVTSSIGRRFRALLDDTAKPMPKGLTELLEALEGSRGQANCSCGAGAG